jgi:hypothetical protein
MSALSRSIVNVPSALGAADIKSPVSYLVDTPQSLSAGDRITIISESAGYACPPSQDGSHGYFDDLNSALRRITPGPVITVQHIAPGYNGALSRGEFLLSGIDNHPAALLFGLEHVVKSLPAGIGVEQIILYGNSMGAGTIASLLTDPKLLARLDRLQLPYSSIVTAPPFRLAGTLPALLVGLGKVAAEQYEKVLRGKTVELEPTHFVGLKNAICSLYPLFARTLDLPASHRFMTPDRLSSLNAAVLGLHMLDLAEASNRHSQNHGLLHPKHEALDAIIYFDRDKVVERTDFSRRSRVIKGGHTGELDAGTVDHLALILNAAIEAGRK